MGPLLAQAGAQNGLWQDDVTHYFPFDDPSNGAGSAYEVDLVPLGNSCASPVFSTSLTVYAHQRVTLLIAGGSASAPDAVQYLDGADPNLSAPQLRFIDAHPNISNGVLECPSSSATLFEGVGYLESSAPTSCPNVGQDARGYLAWRGPQDFEAREYSTGNLLGAATFQLGEGGWTLFVPWDQKLFACQDNSITVDMGEVVDSSCQ